jgi:uncharacterized membrane protein YozB (DUF420 family)
VALFVVLPAFLYGAYVAREGKTRRHAAIMSGVFSVLFVVVLGFVLWNQYLNHSEPPIKDSPLYKSLYVPLAIFHVSIALSSIGLGVFLCVTGVRWRERMESGELRFGTERRRRVHVLAGRAALVLFTLVAVTGLMIYYLRYVFTPS